MAALTLTGFTIPVLASGGTPINLVNVGEYGRGFSGVPYTAVRARGQEYVGRWPLTVRATAAVYRMIVLGQGESWRFSRAGFESYSTKGLGPFGVGGSPSYSSTGGPVSSGPRLNLNVGEGLFYELSVPAINQEATLALWLKSASTSNVWKHYVIEADGGGVLAAWMNGATTSVGSLPDSLNDEWVTFNSLLPIVNLGNSGAADEDMQVAEVMLLPFRASTFLPTWASWPYNSGAGRQAEDFPYLTMGGTWPETGSDEVLGEVQNTDTTDVVSGGSTEIWSSTTFTLRSRLLSR